MSLFEILFEACPNFGQIAHGKICTIKWYVYQCAYVARLRFQCLLWIKLRWHIIKEVLQATYCIKPSLLEFCVRKVLATQFFVTLTTFRVHLLYPQRHQAHPKALLCLKSLLRELTSYICAHRPSHCIDEIYITKCYEGLPAFIFSGEKSYKIIIDGETVQHGMISNFLCLVARSKELCIYHNCLKAVISTSSDLNGLMVWPHSQNTIVLATPSSYWQPVYRIGNLVFFYNWQLLRGVIDLP